MTLGEKLKEARNLSGLSQEQLADKLNVSRSAVAKWETDKGMPDVMNLKAISELLQVSVDYLLNDEEQGHFVELKESIHLEDYKKADGKYFMREDSVVFSKYPKATAVHRLVRQKKLNKAEKIVDFLTLGAIQLADGFNDSAVYYLVESGNRQYLVSVSKDTITSVGLEEKTNEKRFVIGENEFFKGINLLTLKESM